jgi:two-component system chemotaxis response regulator CheB
VLSGNLDDGTAGLSAIKRCGGVAVVQDPAEAHFPDMPRSALEKVDVDYCVPISEMGALIQRLVAEPAPPTLTVPHDLVLEDQAVRGLRPGIEDEMEIGTSTALSCPECGGPLWLLKNPPNDRYRCQIGHAFSEQALQASQETAAEQALWNAVIYLEEHARVIERLAKSEQDRGRVLAADRFDARAAQVRRHVDDIRQVIFSMGKSVATEEAIAEDQKAE